MYDTYDNFPIPGDYGYLAWAYDPVIASTGSTPATGTLYLTALYLRSAAAVSTISWAQTVAGTSPTSSENFVSLWGATGTLLASAEIDATVTAASPVVATASITRTVVNPGFCWVGWLYNCGTNPGVGRAAAGTLAVVNAGLPTVSLRFTSNGTAQTSLPSSITPSSNSTGTGNTFWAALS